MRPAFLVFVRARLSLALVVVLAVLMAFERDAGACGAFAGIRTQSEAELASSLPYLTVEQVLLLWDKETQIEDFIRETRFDRAGKPFGFVVPTPAKPEVSLVKSTPFDALRATYPYERPEARSGLGGMGGGAKGSGAGGAGAEPPVIVLSKQRVGSFTAFTLSASDAGAFDKWLADNGFAMTEAAKPWLAHYVELKFFFVALRYDEKAVAATPDASAEHEMTSETLRIRFKTPLPYYPYYEPVHPAASRPAKRMLTGWLVTRSPMEPVAFKRRAHGKRGDDVRRWQRPWGDGAAYRVSSADLQRALSPEIPIPKNVPDLNVQTFLDLKTSREGFGDVVVVPGEPEEVNAKDDEARKLFVPVIDPTLLDEESRRLDEARDDAGVDAVVDAAAPSPQTSAAPAPLASASSSRRGGCSVARGPAPSSTWLLVIGVLALAGRRRAGRAATLLITLLGPFLAGACYKAKSHTDGSDAAATASASSEPLPLVPDPTARDPMPSREERARIALTILRGGEPPNGIEAAIVRSENAKGEAQVGNTTVTDGEAMDTARVVAGFRPRFRACYNTGLVADPSMSGKIVIEAKLTQGGEVSSATVVRNSGLSPSVAQCCANTVKRAQFTVQSGTPRVTFGVSFVQRD